MEITICFSKEEQEILEQYASRHAATVSEIIRKATLEMIESDADTRAFAVAKAKFEENPVTCTHEEIGNELGFLRCLMLKTSMNAIAP